MKIEKKESRGLNCCSCGERVRMFEKYLQVTNNGKNVRGERYCLNCEKYARLNNDIDDHDDHDGERHLRQMEDWASYRAAGCSEAYWSDRDNGYCN